MRMKDIFRREEYCCEDVMLGRVKIANLYAVFVLHKKNIERNLKKAHDDKENKELTDHKVVENSREHSRIENEIPHSILIKIIFVT